MPLPSGFKVVDEPTGGLPPGFKVVDEPTGGLPPGFKEAEIGVEHPPTLTQKIVGELPRAVPFLGAWMKTPRTRLRAIGEGPDQDFLDFVLGIPDLVAGFKITGGVAKVASKFPALAKTLFSGTTKTGYVLKSTPLAKTMAQELGQLQSAVGLSAANHALANGATPAEAVKAAAKAATDPMGVAQGLGAIGFLRGAGTYGKTLGKGAAARSYAPEIMQAEKFLRSQKAAQDFAAQNPPPPGAEPIAERAPPLYEAARRNPPQLPTNQGGIPIAKPGVPYQPQAPSMPWGQRAYPSGEAMGPRGKRTILGPSPPAPAPPPPTGPPVSPVPRATMTTDGKTFRTPGKIAIPQRAPGTPIQTGFSPPPPRVGPGPTVTGESMRGTPQGLMDYFAERAELGTPRPSRAGTPNLVESAREAVTARRAPPGPGQVTRQTIEGQGPFNPVLEPGRGYRAPRLSQKAMTKRTGWKYPNSPREAGRISRRTLLTLGAAGAGAAAGAVSDREHPFRNALIGAAGMVVLFSGGKGKGLTNPKVGVGEKKVPLPETDPTTGESLYHKMAPPPAPGAKEWTAWHRQELSDLATIKLDTRGPRLSVKAWKTTAQRLDQVNAMFIREADRRLREAGISPEEASRLVAQEGKQPPAVEFIRDYYENVRVEVGNKVAQFANETEMGDLGRTYINRIYQHPTYHIGSGDTYHVFYSLKDAKEYAKAHPEAGEYSKVHHWTSDNLAGNLRMRSKNQLKRFYETEEEALAKGFRFLPDADSALVRMQYYAQMQDRALLNQRLAQDLVEIPDLLRPMEKGPTPGYTPVESGTLAKMTTAKRLWGMPRVTKTGKEIPYTAKQVRMLSSRAGDRVLVKDEWAPYVKAAYSPGLTWMPARQWLRFGSVVKAGKLIFATFHPISLSLSGVVQTAVRHPFMMTITTAKTIPRFARALVFGEKIPGKTGLWNDLAVLPRSITHPEQAAEALSDGLVISAPLPMQRHVADEVIRLGEAWSDRAMGRLPSKMLEPFRLKPRPLSWAKQRFDKALWDVAFQDLKMMFWAELKANNMKWVDRGILTVDDVGQAVAEQMNYAFGGHIWEALPGILKDPKFKDFVTGVGFAPDWYVSNWGNPIRSVSTLVPRAGETAAQAASRKLEGSLARQYMMGVTAYFAVADAVNLYTTKRDFGVAYHTWETPGNDPTMLKNLFNVYLGKRFDPRKGKYLPEFAQVGKHVAEMLGAIDTFDPVQGVANYAISKVHPAIRGPLAIAYPESDYELMVDMDHATTGAGRVEVYMKHLAKSWGAPFWVRQMKPGPQTTGFGAFSLHKGSYYKRLERQMTSAIRREDEITAEIAAGHEVNANLRKLTRLYAVELPAIHDRIRSNGFDPVAMAGHIKSGIKKGERAEERERSFYDRQ